MNNRIKIYRTDSSHEIHWYKEQYDAGQITAENAPYDLIMRVEEIDNKDSNGTVWPNKVFMHGLKELRGGFTDKWYMRFGYFSYLIVTFENGKILFSPSLDSYPVQKEFAEKIKAELQFADDDYVEIDDIVF